MAGGSIDVHPFIELMRQLKSRQQVLVLVCAGFATLAMMLIFPFAWISPSPPAQGVLTRMQGVLTGDVETWKDDRSLLYYTVRYRLPSGTSKIAAIYSDKARFKAANLKARSPVWLDVEDITGRSRVRRLITLQDEVLYSPELQDHVVLMNHESVIRGLVFGGFLAFCWFVAAGVIHYRSSLRRET